MTRDEDHRMRVLNWLSFIHNLWRDKMSIRLKTSTAMIIGLLGLVGCATMPTPPPLPTGGYIAYVKKDHTNKTELYRQDMVGTTVDGSPHKLSGVNLMLNNDIRYVNMTPDGKFLYFTERDSDPLESINDTIKMTNASGEVIWSSSHAGCDILNYPKLLTYGYDEILNEVSFQLFAYCDGVGMGITASKIPNNPVIFAASSSYAWQSYDPNIQNGYSYLSPPAGGLEWAAVPEEFSANSALMDTLNVPYIHTGEDLNFNITQNNISLSNQPVTKCNGNNTSPIVVKDEFKVDAGHPANGISLYFAYTLKKAFAPSISANGEYVMFNSEVHEDDPSRNEELFAVTLPADWCQGYQIVSQTPPPGGAAPLPTIPYHSDMLLLNSSSGNEYGAFAANTGTAYIMHRHNDPDNGGRTSLYIAPDINTPAVRLHPNATENEQEGAWFYQ